MPQVDISIVIVNYKSWLHLASCLDSLAFHSDSFNHEIVVVDNHSNDGKLAEFSKVYPDVVFVENTGNNGFANGCNLGASKSKGRYLLFLNPDTVGNENAIKSLWQFAKQNPHVGITSCLQEKKQGGYEPYNRQFLRLSTLFGLFRAVRRLLVRSEALEDENMVYTDWVSGSLVCISRQWFEQVGGWNEDYWMYYEDMDLSKRVRALNGKVVVLKNAAIQHSHGGASRINLKTAALTKTEVQISKHVYISNHFKGVERACAHLLLFAINCKLKFIIALLSMPVFFITKARLNVYLFLKIIRYYWHCLLRGTWMSPNAISLKN